MYGRRVLNLSDQPFSPPFGPVVAMVLNSHVEPGGLPLPVSSREPPRKQHRNAWKWVSSVGFVTEIASNAPTGGILRMIMSLTQWQPRPSLTRVVAVQLPKLDHSSKTEEILIGNWISVKQEQIFIKPFVRVCTTHTAKVYKALAQRH
ncbi:hypothetical protein PCANC_18345 [Puccinia coronata f. sp. avenae]|uniref:Uncharacterized protein n=1 Tax=Puccinia coronata f. sp. avenae TaxID=200324 RepID=A0A2N5SN65_9BASI|nr:hypothetical protein PCANC_18345 [Puccinia coronata f. sp. avenae]